MADFGKGTGGSHHRIRNKRVIAHRRAPLHLRAIANKFAREAAVHRVGVLDIEPLMHSTPDQFERHGSRHGRRTATEQGIRDISIIEDCDIGCLERGASLSKLHVDSSDWNLGGPEQSDRRKCTRIEVMNLIARTGQIDVDSNKGKSALVNSPVRATELALHEPHIRIDEG